MIAPDDAPVDILLNSTEQLVVEAVVVVAALGAIAWCFRRCKIGLPTTLAVLIGAALTTITAEPAFDRLGGVAWAIRGDTPHTLVVLFGTSVPFWMMPVYVLVLGVGGAQVVQRLDEGAAPRELLGIYGFWVVADALLEHGLLHLTNLYRYYGDHQPLFDATWWRQPLWFTAGTATGPLVVAGCVLVSRELDGWLRPWILVPLIPAGFFGWYMFCAGPAVAADNSDVSHPVAHLLGVVAVAMTVLFTWQILCRQLPRLAAAQAAKPARESVAA
jgi:hypothetical protein